MVGFGSREIARRHVLHLGVLRSFGLKLILNFVVLDLVSLDDPADVPEAYLAAVSLLRRVPYILAFCLKAEVELGTVYNIVALVCVGLVGSDPTLWPGIWENWRRIYRSESLGVRIGQPSTPHDIDRISVGDHGTNSCNRCERSLVSPHNHILMTIF